MPFKEMRAGGRQNWFSIEEQLLYRNVQRVRGGLVFKAHRLSYHSSLGRPGGNPGANGDFFRQLPYECFLKR